MSQEQATLLLVMVAASCFITTTQAFHLSFGHRLRKYSPTTRAPTSGPTKLTTTETPAALKSVNSPQLNPDSHLIRPVECRNAHNHSEAGICMFSIDCMQNKGTPLSVCKHKYFVGTCCRLPDYNNFVGIVYDLRDTETNHVLEAREVSAAQSSPSEYATAPTRIEATSVSVSAAAAAATTATKESSDFFDGRYRISSTSLFGPTTGAPPPSSKASESARNADASVESSGKLVELANLELETRLQSMISNNQTDSNSQQQEAPIKVQLSSGEQKHAYEIVKDLDSEVLSTFSSVHSPPSVMLPSKPPSTGQQQQQQQQPIMYRSTAPPQLSSQQPSLAYEMSSMPSTTAAHSSAAAAITAPVPTTTSAPEPNAGQGEVALASRSPTGDQEFTLSTSGDTSPASRERPTNTPQPTTQAYLLGSSVSDLVSSNGGGQTTTPFTVSLSTALLPNISSHPYAPTQQPTTALVSSQSLSTQQHTKSSSPPATSSSQSYESSLANFSQLYSNQHSSSASMAEPAAAAVHSSRPTLHSTLHAASKIVTGSSSNNNLIPGLSNLQSAILSQFPFKIASGLSSYLQAAMKPTGSRPLISSNTAPSLQYQQQQANSSRSPPSTTTTTTTTTTSTTATSSQSTTPAVMLAPSLGVRFPGDNELQVSSTVSFPMPSSSSSSSNQAYDVVRESQRVCGRPQVQHTLSLTTPLAEGVNKRMARIVGGNQSSFGQWPWMVSLRQWRKGAFLHKCGAALLNENWAITAAHCVEDVKVTDLLLRLGEFDVSNQEEPYPFVERRVKTVKSHPLFNPKTFEYDLALLKFADPIKYERNIIPVCVPSGNDSYIDRMATVIGWGRLYEDGPLPDVIQHVDVPIITNNECEKMYKNAGYIEEIPDMFICAGINKGGRDSCEGDSGGPLTMVDHDGRSYLVGIISWGIGCALPSQPGVYTRITAFSGWINELAGS